MNNNFFTWLGGVVNALGFPGFVREGDYRARTPRCDVQVRRGRTYTVISVNGTDVYFDRLTGRIDGCGARVTGK